MNLIAPVAVRSLRLQAKISGLALLQSYDVGMGLGPSNLRVVSGGVWILREIAFQVQHVQQYNVGALKTPKV